MTQVCKIQQSFRHEYTNFLGIVTISACESTELEITGDHLCGGEIFQNIFSQIG